MGIITSNKEINVRSIKSGGSFKVKLTLTAEPNLSSNPIEVVLILDKSASMYGEPLTYLKTATESFIDILDEAADGSQDNSLGESRAAIIGFSDSATVETALISNTTILKSAVNRLTPAGKTNHAAAFAKAIELLNKPSVKEKIIVMITDGKTTIGQDAYPIVNSAKAMGIKIYCLGLLGNCGINEKALCDWASCPVTKYALFSPSAHDLQKFFEQIAESISGPGATNIIINEQVNSDFEITEISPHSKGTAVITGSDSLRWNIPVLGARKTETAQLEFTVKHLGKTMGVLIMNKEIIYKDNEFNNVEFPVPKIEVNGAMEILPEECPVPVEIEIDCCKDCIEYDMGQVEMQSLGRIMQLDITMKNICPNRRVALAVILTEVDENGGEHKRGLKTAVVPAHYNQECRDIKIKCLKFVLPEELDVSGGCTSSICNSRHFKARIISHYIDHDFECCEVIIP